MNLSIVAVCPENNKGLIDGSKSQKLGTGNKHISCFGLIVLSLITQPGDYRTNGGVSALHRRLITIITGSVSNKGRRC